MWAFPSIRNLKTTLLEALATGRGRAGTLVFDGDSISVGVGAPAGSTLADQVSERLRFAASVHVVGAGGSPVFERDTAFDQTVAPLYNPDAPKNIIVFHAGDNDIFLGADAAQTYRCLTSYIDKARRQGWIVVLSTELQRFDFSPAQQDQLTRYNSMMLDNAAGADGVVDFASDPVMGGRENRDNPRYYTWDHVHPTAAGYAILAKALSAELRRHLQAHAAR